MRDEKIYDYDVFISYRWVTPDQEWVREQLYPALVAAGLKVCLDVEDFVPGRDLILEMERAGQESRHVLCVISPEYFEAGRMVEFESLSAQRRDPAGRLSSLIPIILREAEIPERIRGLISISWTDPNYFGREWKKLLRALGATNVSVPFPNPLQSGPQYPSNRPTTGDIYGENQVRNPVQEQEGKIVVSLRKRLEKDFYTSGPRAGQFGKERIPMETQLYQEAVRETLKVKPNYYMTYWGWKLAFDFLPELAKEWAQLTVHALKDRFGGKRWIEVDLESYDSSPSSPIMKVETVRHTVKAAEIFLLINQTSIPSQVAWNLINESQRLTAKGGWKEFRTDDGSASLWSSAYAFRFLSKVARRMCNPDVPGEADSFIEKSADLIHRTESHLESHWHKEKWKFHTLPWEVNAPVLFIECLPYLQNTALIKNVFETLRELVTPAGRLVNPDTGTPYQAPEYILSLRLAYALKLCTLLEKQTDSRVDNLIGWILESYSEQYTLDTCDIAFLYGLIRQSPHIAY